MAKKVVRAARQSMVEFARAKRRAACKLCALPEPIKQQLKVARSRKIPREVQIEWLRVECHVVVTQQEVELHRNGRHDYGA